MILLPLPILAPLIIRFRDTEKEKEKRVTNKEDEIISKKNKTKTNCFQKIESCSDYWHKFFSFIGTPCIKYAYYFVNKILFIFIYLMIPNRTLSISFSLVYDIKHNFLNGRSE